MQALRQSHQNNKPLPQKGKGEEQCMQRLSLYFRGIQGRFGILKCALCKTKAIKELKLGEHDKRHLCLMHYRQYLNRDKVYNVSYEKATKGE